MQTVLDRLLTTEGFDIVQVESTQMSVFDFGPRATVLLDEHNIEYELLYRMCRTEQSPLRKVYNWAEFLKFRREERRAWRRADGCALTSAREEQIVRGYVPDKPTAVVPNGVDIEYFAPRSEPVVGHHIVFTGLMLYRPNIDAAVYFAREILPTILRHRANARFVIVGAGPTEEVRRLAGPNVHVTGTVPDVRPYVHDAAALVVPLRMGSGTRLKVLEGLAMGKAMVSTSLGCEGIDVRHGEHLLVADEPEAFAQAVLQLLDRRELAKDLGERGRALTEATYSWSSVGAQLEMLHNRLRWQGTESWPPELVARSA
jgi:glycosyltransferase involved in cell wall biosynthesis